MVAVEGSDQAISSFLSTYHEQIFFPNRFFIVRAGYCPLQSRSEFAGL